MELARRLDVLSEGVPNVRAFLEVGSEHGTRAFAGWQVPSLDELERALLDALRHGLHLQGGAAEDAAEGARLMKT